MKIGLDEQIWDRLYGPYGNRSVNLTLAQLADRWETSVAKELFWEELHHQDDIYPSTYAALPWLVDICPAEGDAHIETQVFISHVIHCACLTFETGFGGHEPKSKFRGLSTQIEDHQHSWLPSSDWLTTDDRTVLIEMEKWFARNCDQLAKKCLELVGSDMSLSAHVLEGFATLKGSSKVAYSVQMFVGGEDLDEVRDEVGDYDEQDTKVVRQLYPLIHDQNAQIASFIASYP